MRKKQKTHRKEKSQRAYKDFIFIVKWYKNNFDVMPYIVIYVKMNIKKKKLLFIDYRYGEI